MKNNRLPGNRPPKKPLSQEAQKHAILLAVNSILLLFIYFGSLEIRVEVIPAGVLTPYPIMIGQCVYLAYWIAFGAFLIAYIGYNRAFKFKGVTAEMLPDTMTEEQKADFIADVKRRAEKSKWMISVIVPLLVTVAADAIYLFTWPMVQNLFNIS